MSTQQDAPPRERSAFAAGFLSLIFPGLGHVYARAWKRAVIFAAPPLALLALLAGTYLSYGTLGIANFVSSQMLVAILIGNVVAYLYRIVAAVDAWRVVAFVNRYEKRAPRGLVTPTLRIASIAGLIATCMVMGAVHAAVAYYDSLAISADQALHDLGPDLSGTPNPSDTIAPAPSLPPDLGSAAPALPSDSPDASASSAPTDWIPGQRLNMLLIGSDQRPGDSTFNTDTLIVASIDPDTKQVAMFTLPRDTVGVPLPPGPLRTANGGPIYNNKINSLVTWVREQNISKYKGTAGAFRALEDTLGYLYGMPIYYYVMVNFNGFRQVVDALGGVTINVQKPVVDDYYPGDDGQLIRVYIPTGVQHMSGAQALIYARSRHGSADFDRGARQQRVLLSLRQQVDLSTLMQPQVLNALVSSIGSAVKTDFPFSNIGPALQLAQQIDVTNVRSFVFGPPTYSTDLWACCHNSNIVIKLAPIQRAVKNAFKFSPAELKSMQDIADEGANVWVLDGAHTGIAPDVAGYLEFMGVAASAPNQNVTGTAPANTVIKVYNGAEQNDPKTVALLQGIFHVTAQLVTDPKMKVDIVITTGRNTQDLQAPNIGN